MGHRGRAGRSRGTEFQPISAERHGWRQHCFQRGAGALEGESERRSVGHASQGRVGLRSEEHTSELQSRLHLVCRLLLEKKKKKTTKLHHYTMQSVHVTLDTCARSTIGLLT